MVGCRSTNHISTKFKPQRFLQLLLWMSLSHTFRCDSARWRWDFCSTCSTTSFNYKSWGWVNSVLRDLGASPCVSNLFSSIYLGYASNGMVKSLTRRANRSPHTFWGDSARWRFRYKPVLWARIDAHLPTLRPPAHPLGRCPLPNCRLTSDHHCKRLVSYLIYIYIYRSIYVFIGDEDRHRTFLVGTNPLAGTNSFFGDVPNKFLFFRTHVLLSYGVVPSSVRVSPIRSTTSL